MKLNENKLRQIIRESIKSVLNEYQGGSMGTEVQKEGEIGKLLNESTRDNLLLPYLNVLRERGDNCNLGQLKNFLMKKFVVEGNMHALSLGSNFYLSGVARYYFNGDLTENTKLNIFYPEITDKFKYDICQRLDEIIVYLRNAYIDTTGTQWEQPEDFGTLTISALFKKYGGKVDKLKNKNNPKSVVHKYANEPTNVGNDYTFDIMYSQDDCKKYNEVTSPGAWCITYAQQHYNAYTKRNKSHFVILSKNGYENTPRKVGNNFPKDEYGLSLLAVQQSDVDGRFICCTTRWNHGGYNGVPSIPNADYALSYDEIKKVTGLSDEKFQIIFNIWEENKKEHKGVDRSKLNAIKLEAARKFKYAQMLFRNGTSMQQLHDDGWILEAYPLSPKEQNDFSKINKSIFAISTSVDGGNEKYFTIMDRGEVKPNEILCNGITHGDSYNLNWYMRNEEFGNRYAVCDTKSGYMFYFYKLHNIINIDGEKYFKEIKQITNDGLFSLTNVSGGKSIIDINTGGALRFPNGETICERVEKIIRDWIIEVVYDSSANMIFYYDLKKHDFIKDLEGYVIPYVSNKTKLMEENHVIPVTTKNNGYMYSEGIKFFDVLNCEFVEFGGNTSFYHVLYTNNFILIQSENDTNGLVYLFDTREQFTYPDGNPVIASSMIGYSDSDFYYRDEKKYNYVDFTIDHSSNIDTLYDLYTKKFYVNQDGSYFFKVYGIGKVYDMNNNCVVELPETADGEYWYQQKKYENNDVEKLLNEGLDVEEIFDSLNGVNIDGYMIGRLNNIECLLVMDGDSYRMVKNTWFLTISPYFHCGYSIVETIGDNTYDNKNYIDINCDLLLDKDKSVDIRKLSPFNEEKKQAICNIFGTYNIIDINGDFLFERSNGLYNIKDARNEKYYYVKQNRRQRNWRYMSLNGRVFNTPSEAQYDSDNNEPINSHKEEKRFVMKESLLKNVDFYGKYPVFKLSGEGLDKYSHVVNEVIDECCCGFNGVNNCLTRESLDEICDDDMNDVMSSFDVHDELNDKFWVDSKLNPKVRLRLLDIADKFFNSLEVNWVKPDDIIMTGSLCNYNWSKYSDIDLHIVVDFDDVDERTLFVKDYFDSKKKLWNDAHENLTIFGFPLELYVQDVNEEHTASGIYSIMKNEWIKHPEKNGLSSIRLDKKTISHKVEKIADRIDSLEFQFNKEKDVVKIDSISMKIKALFDNIKGMRKESLKCGGEFSQGNIIFKCLRRLGYIGKLVDLKTKSYDKINSIR